MITDDIHNLKIFKQALYIFSPKVNGHNDYFTKNTDESYKKNYDNGLSKLLSYTELILDKKELI